VEEQFHPDTTVTSGPYGISFKILLQKVNNFEKKLCIAHKRKKTGIKLLIILKVLLNVSVKKTRNPAQIFRFAGMGKIQKDNQALGFERLNHRQIFDGEAFLCGVCCTNSPGEYKLTNLGPRTL